MIRPTHRPGSGLLQMIAGCVSMTPVDVIWALPNEADWSDTESLLRLMTSVATFLEIGPTSVQVGVAPRVCSDEKPAIRLKDHDTFDGFQTALEDLRLVESTNVDKQLEYLRTQGFAARNGARSEAVKVALLVVNRPSANQDAVIREIAKVHKASIKLIVIGVGAGVNDDELSVLASNGGTLVRTDSFAALEQLHVNLVQRICTAIRGIAAERRDSRLFELLNDY